MIKYFCTKCLDTCEYMGIRKINVMELPVDIDGKHVGCEHERSSVVSGSICMLCHEELPLEPNKYLVNVTEYLGHEYIDGCDLWEIRQNENSCNR